MQTACRESFKIRKTQYKTKENKSVSWWAERFTIMRKRINALRRPYQRTINNEELRESRKHKCLEEKKNINKKLEIETQLEEGVL